MVKDLRSSLAPRARLVGRGFLVGVLLGALAVLGLFAYSGDVGFANRKAFAIGALFLGLGLLGWSGTIMAGREMENLQEYLDMNSSWTKEDSRQAMALVGGAGFGWMIGVAITTAAASAVV
ncbi:MAG: Na+/phosphate symporter [Halobacteriales archaeon]|jgi:Na+/phosphate symporter